MAYREVRSLQGRCAEVLVDTLVLATEQKVIAILQPITNDVLRSHHRNTRGGPCSCIRSASEVIQTLHSTAVLHGDLSRCYFVKSVYKVKKVLDKCRLWWSFVPSSSSGPRDSLNAALDLRTDYPFPQYGNFSVHLTCMCLKLLLLQEVFLDRDYGDKDKSCLVPYLWEEWFGDLLRELKPFCFHTLNAYGALYPSLLGFITQNAPNLISISLSHINITDDLLLSIGCSCPYLEKLYLKHCYPWTVISLKYFTLAFFKGQTVEYVMRCLQESNFHEVQLSFPRLREIELCYGEHPGILHCHLFLSCFYKNVKFVLSLWQINLMNEWYHSYCEDVVQESIGYTGASSLDHLYITANHLFELSKEQLRNLSWNLPLLANVTMCCDTLETRSSVTDARRIGDNLSILATDNDRITSISVSLSDNEDFYVSILRPFLVIKSTTLTDITLEASGSSEILTITFLQQVLATSTVLCKFRIIVGDLNNIQFPPEFPESFVLPERKTLREIWLHDNIPSFRPPDEIKLRHYITLNKSMMTSAPDLQTVSISVCQRTESILNQISSNVSGLHVQLNDGCEFQPPIEQWIRMIHRHPNLQDIYLDDVCEETFWKLQKRFASTRLMFHWGTLDGWPRS